MNCRDCKEVMTSLTRMGHLELVACRNCGRLLLVDEENGKVFEYQLTEDSPLTIETPTEESEVQDFQTIESRDTADLYGVVPNP